MAYTQQLLYEPIRSIDSTTFNGTFLAVGTPLANAASIVRIVNNSGVAVTVSVDGTTTVDVVPADSNVPYNATANSTSQNNVFVPKGTQYYVSGTASTGLVYVVVLYIKTA